MKTSKHNGVNISSKHIWLFISIWINSSPLNIEEIIIIQLIFIKMNFVEKKEVKGTEARGSLKEAN